MRATYLADPSVIARGKRQAVHDRIAPLIEGGQLVICGLIELELLFSARGYRELTDARARRVAAVALVDMEQADFDRATQVMTELAKRGKHRVAGIADLLVAACAERSGLTLLHYDSDFDAIGAVTGQPTEWVVPRGSLS